MSVKTKLELLENRIRVTRKNREQVRVALSSNCTLSISELANFFIRVNDVRELLVAQDKKLCTELSMLENKLKRIEELLA